MRKTVAAILIALFLALAAFLCWANFVFINRTFYPTNLEKIDLSGQTIDRPRRLARLSALQEADLRGTQLSAEDFMYLRQSLPNCTILWDPPYGGSFHSADTTVLRINTLTGDDLQILEYLPNLKRIDAAQCRDYDMLMALQRSHPKADLNYFVPLGGTDRNSHETSLDIADANPEELLANLPYLPRAKQIHLTGTLPKAEDMLRLMQTFPTISWTCQISGRPITVSPNTVQLDLTGFTLRQKDVRFLLDSCTKLQKVTLLDCGLTEKDCKALADAYPNCLFIWDITLAGVNLRTNAAEIDISDHKVDSIYEVEEALPYFPRLKKVIMCNCGLTNEEMDKLNTTHPDIRFIWSVKVGPITLRTDAKFFAPVVTGNNVYNRDLKALHYCTDIVAVDIGHMYVTDISWVASMPDLRYLIIADTQVSDISPLASLKKLVFLEMFMTPCRDFSPLLECTALEDLNLCFTYGSPEPIRKMTWLKRLWWSGNWVATKGLAEYLPNTQTNFSTESSTGGTWRDGAHYKEQRDILGMPYFHG